jgi:uncharacterized membrane protein YgcG
MIVYRYDILHRVVLLCAFYMVFFINVANASVIYTNDGVISQKVSDKLEEMGSELFEKSGISVYVAAPKSLEGQSIQEYEEKVANSLNSPYVLFTLAKSEQQVDIIYSESLEGKFDKEKTLSPFPWSGTVIPLLSVKKDNDKYNAAILNGYADIVEQIANSYDIKLQSAIGNTNRDILFWVKMGIYAFVLVIILRYAYNLARKRNA